MRLLRVHVIKADTCGGLLDGLDIRLRAGTSNGVGFEPLCLIGPNGSGKSQFLQVIAEIFQSAFHAIVPEDERIEGNSGLEFEVEYLTRAEGKKTDSHVRISRQSKGKKRPPIVFEIFQKNKWGKVSVRPETH
jgi:ABC-type Mn2+/Zn2+ transport system ATPase subunit